MKANSFDTDLLMVYEIISYSCFCYIKWYGFVSSIHQQLDQLIFVTYCRLKIFTMIQSSAYSDL